MIPAWVIPMTTQTHGFPCYHKKAQVTSPAACCAFSAPTTPQPSQNLVEPWWNPPRGILVEPWSNPAGGTLVEPSWNLTPGSPRTTPEPIWAETPKLSVFGEKVVLSSGQQGLTRGKRKRWFLALMSCFSGPALVIYPRVIRSPPRPRPEPWPDLGSWGNGAFTGCRSKIAGRNQGILKYLQAPSAYLSLGLSCRGPYIRLCVTQAIIRIICPPPFISSELCAQEPPPHMRGQSPAEECVHCLSSGTGLEVKGWFPPCSLQEPGVHIPKPTQTTNWGFPESCCHPVFKKASLVYKEIDTLEGP